MWDFAIIGGGIAGLSAGAALSTLGRVLVLEGEAQTGYHASGRSAALYEADYGSGPVVALAQASAGPLAEMGVLSPRGMMVVGAADQAEAFARDLEELRLNPLDPAEALAMVPILDPGTLVFAGYTALARDIDTDLLMQLYARRIRAAGGEIRTRARVSTIEKTEHGWALEAGGVALNALRVVNAAGAWADRVAVMAGLDPVGIMPLRRSMAQIPAPEGHDVSGWPMVFGAGEGWYMKPQAGKLLVSPADEEPMEPHDAWADDMVLAEGLARYEAMVSTPVTRVETSWAGLRSFAPDRVPLLGPDPAQPSFLWCAGQGGQGFLSAPGAAAALLEAAGGAASGLPASVIAALSPARLRR